MRPGPVRSLFVGSLLLLATAASLRAGGKDSRLVLGLGDFDDGPGGSTGLMVDYRTPRRVLGASKLLGELLVTDDGAYYLGTGIYQDVPLGRFAFLTPSLGLGFYENGGDKQLGHHLEFRAGLGVNVKLNERLRLGFLYHHLSNASLSDVNSGAESYLFTLSFPLGR